MRNKILGLVAASLAFGMWACGDDTTVNENTALDVVSSGEKLEKCTDDNEGAMAYVSDSAAVYYCADGKWQTLNGKDGSDGEDGKDGEDGTSSVDTIVKIDTLVLNSLDTVFQYDTLVIQDTILSVDTVVVNQVDTVKVFDTTTVIYTPEYDTVSTALLNQDMLANGDYGILVDKRDNKVYRTITIGSQTWMAQNMNYNDAGIISYSRSEEHTQAYGRFYMWAQAMNLDDSYNRSRATNSSGGDSILVDKTQGICPEGWHIPNMTEMNTLTNWITSANTVASVSEQTGYSMKSGYKWSTGENSLGVGSDRYGFSLQPAGSYVNGTFSGHGAWGIIWLASESNASNARRFALSATTHETILDAVVKTNAYSVRCLKN